ncbi:hypothetical protein DIC82_08255 [Clostridium beijerinckii]|nr:hypothetical protein DIC82_08255 [Clostridium beijerinckii]
MSKDDDFASGAGEELKKDIKNIYKHSKRAIKGFFRGGNRRNNCGRRPNWGPPLFAFKSPLLMLLWPKIIVAGIILLTLLLCGVSLYGVIIILLLTLIFILI